MKIQFFGHKIGITIAIVLQQTYVPGLYHLVQTDSEKIHLLGKLTRVRRKSDLKIGLRLSVVLFLSLCDSLSAL